MAKPLLVDSQTPPPLEVEATTASQPITTPWADIVLAVVGLRMLLSLVGGGILVLLPQAHQSWGARALLLEPWRHFDALWFTQIAAHGYQAGSLNMAYLPIYPLLIRVVSVITFGHYLSAALIVSNVACVVGVGLLWRWVAEIYSPKVAWRTVTLFLLFPDAFYLLGAYSEALFLAFSASCLLAIRRDQWLLAGLLAALATLTRLQGLVLMVPILLALWPKREAPRQLLVGLVAAGMPGLALLAYQYLLMSRLGGGTLVDTFQHRWGIPLQTPWQTIGRYIDKIRSPQWHLINSPQANYVLLWDLLIAIVVLGVLLLSSKRLGWQLSLYGIAAWCFALTRWYSTGRYMLAVLPFFIAVALWTEGHGRLRQITTGSLILLVFFTAEFAQNSWID